MPTPDAFDLPSVETPEDEFQREQDWDRIVYELRDFALRHGWPAAARALAEAMNPQAGLIRG